MNSRQIINEVANSKEYKQLCKNITKGNELWEDLFQELIIILCNYDKAKIEDLYQKKQLKWFIIKILQNQYNSQTSDFHKTHKSFNQRSEEIVEVKQEEINKEDEYYNSMVEFEKNKEEFNTSGEWYENKLFFAYLNEGSQRGLEAKTGISRAAIKNTLEPYIDKIKEKSEVKRTFMEQTFFRVEIPPSIKEDIFLNSLYQNLSPEELIVQQLKKINKLFKCRTQKIKPNQLRLF